jgi:hypothetical protein
MVFDKAGEAGDFSISIGECLISPTIEQKYCTLTTMNNNLFFHINDKLNILQGHMRASQTYCRE